MTEIEIGKLFVLGSYETHGWGSERVAVRVYEIDEGVDAWYDDHQGGGWWYKGAVYYRTSSGECGYQSLEYARDNWSEIDEDEERRIVRDNRQRDLANLLGSIAAAQRDDPDVDSYCWEREYRAGRNAAAASEMHEQLTKVQEHAPSLYKVLLNHFVPDVTENR